MGLSGDGRLHLRARPEARIEKDAARRAFLRVVVRQDGTELRARAAGGQASSQLRPMADANGLLVVPEGPDGAEPDRLYDVIMIGPVAEGS
jgi:molybdopterin biosynthesis enzyme